MQVHQPAVGVVRHAQASSPAALALLALLISQLACGAATRGNPERQPAPDLADGDVTVSAALFGFTLSTDTVAAGAVRFVVTNDDAFLPHDFRLAGDGVEVQTARLAPGESEVLSVDLAAGTYTYFCTVEGHRENMRGTLTAR
jgi:plastocyanin